MSGMQNEIPQPSPSEAQKNLISNCEVSDSDITVGWVLMGASALASVGMIIMRFMVAEYFLERWVQYMCVIPAISAAVWFVYFVSALTHNLIVRRSRKKRGGVFRLDLLIACLKLSIGGIVYTGFWLLFVLHATFKFRSHLVQLLALVKLGSTHLLYALLFRSKTRLSLLNVVGGLLYITIGCLVELLAEDQDFLKYANLAIGSALTLLALIEVFNSHFIVSASLAVFASAFFVSAFQASRHLVAGLSLLALILFGVVAVPVVQDGIASMTAMLFGSWKESDSQEGVSGSSSGSEDKPGELDATSRIEEEPLLSSRSAEDKKFIVF